MPLKLKPTLCFDYDFLLFQASCVTERSYIKVMNKITTEELTFKSRTEFYGNWRKKNGGYLAEINKSRTSPYTVEDFIIEDAKKVEPIENAIHILNNSIKSIASQLNTNKYYGYTGKGDTFRMQVATLQEYKGNRKDMQKPIHLDELKAYLVKKHEAEIVTYYEADDYCAMDAWDSYKKYNKTKSESDKLITVAIDKDAKGVTSFLFNPNKHFEPIHISGLGSLYRDDKGDIDGIGRAWFYYQVAYGDTADNYDPACLSKVKNGEVAVFNRLGQCKTDEEFLKALVLHFQNLYPEPITFTNFREDNLTVDWLYVMQEMFDLAWMKRWEDDRLIVTDILDKFGVNYA